MNEKQLLLDAALSRMPFLSAPMRGVLSENLDNLDSLALLSKIDLEKICQRELKRLTWNPERVIARAQRDVRLMNHYVMDLVSWNDLRYPPLLKEIPQPPFALYVRGNAASLCGGSNGMLGIVGTRHPDGAGVQAAFDTARNCADRGITIVSGLAAGIDTAAHRGALAVVTDITAPNFYGPWTVGVCGTGLDQIYPVGNKRLAVQMMRRGGCLVSEYPPETPGSRWTFPERNRIISGMSFGVLVVEAPAKSGALITADFALEQGRELFLHPVGVEYSRRIDTIDNQRTVASLALDGAIVTGSADEILPHSIVALQKPAKDSGQLEFDLY